MEQLSNNATQLSPTVKKYGPCGSMAGSEQQIDHIIGNVDRISNIYVEHNYDILQSLTVSFQRFGGTKKYSYFLGKPRRSDPREWIEFEEDECIECVKGCFGSYKNRKIVKSIQIVTNYTIYGPYGTNNGDDQHTAFEFKTGDGQQIIGFHGRHGESIDAIGVYVKRNMEKRKKEETEELEQTRGKLKTVKQSLPNLESRRKEEGISLMDASNKLRKTQESLNNLYQQVQKDYQELGNCYSTLLDENKALKKMEILTKEYEKFRTWIEEQAYISGDIFRFKKYNPSDIKAALNDSNNTVFLGAGGCGTVSKTVIDGTTVAIKSLINCSEEDVRQFNQEVEILRRIRHPNLVILIGACPERYQLVYEFLPNGSLKDRLFRSEDHVTLPWRERIKIAASICSALVFLHNTKPEPIAHGDLKPDNILFDSNNVCKLSDFGISRHLKVTDDMETPKHVTDVPKGTPSYRDPDFEKSRKLTPQSDVYAFGIILLQLVTGKCPMDIRRFIFEQLHTTAGDDVKVKLKAFKSRGPQQRKKLLDYLLKDAKLENCNIDEVITMTCLGLRCSDPVRTNRPDLVTEVWSEIDSMGGFASDS